MTFLKEPREVHLVSFSLRAEIYPLLVGAVALEATVMSGSQNRRGASSPMPRCIKFGAGDRTRTGTEFPPRDFKSRMSTISITPAYGANGGTRTHSRSITKRMHHQLCYVSIIHILYKIFIKKSNIYWWARRDLNSHSI